MHNDQGKRPPRILLPRIPDPVVGRAAAEAGSSGGTRTASTGAPPGPPARRGSEAAGGRA